MKQDHFLFSLRVESSRRCCCPNIFSIPVMLSSCMFAWVVFSSAVTWALGFLFHAYLGTYFWEMFYFCMVERARLRYIYSHSQLVELEFLSSVFWFVLSVQYPSMKSSAFSRCLVSALGLVLMVLSSNRGN